MLRMMRALRCRLRDRTAGTCPIPPKPQLTSDQEVRARLPVKARKSRTSGVGLQGRRIVPRDFGAAMNSQRFPCTFPKACHVLWLFHHARMKQTAIAIMLRLNVGTVNHVVHGRRFPDAYPIAPVST